MEEVKPVSSEIEARKRRVLGTVLVIMMISFAVIRQIWQKGKKLIGNAHPWDYIALVVVFAALFYALYRFKKSRATD